MTAKLQRFTDFFKNGRNFYIVLFAALLFANFPFGFRYFAFSDDYNAYGVFAMFREDIWNDVMVTYNIYGMRPLAGLTDAYVIAWFWRGGMAVVLLAITSMRFASIYLLDAIFKKSGVIWGRAAAVFFGFFPALTESAYWISASSRIAVTLFFCTSAVYAMLRFIYADNGGRHKWLWFTAACVCGLLAQGFYEQGIIFAFTFTLGILIYNRHAVKYKILYTWPFINLALIGVWSYVFRNVGHLGGRTAATDNSMLYQFWDVTKRIVLTFVHEQGPTVANTFRWGFGQLISEHTFVFMLIIIFSAAFALFIAAEQRGTEHDGKQYVRSLVAGLTLLVCTFAVFYILSESWIWVRNYFFSLIGLAVIIEVCIRAVRLKRYETAVQAAKGIAVFAAAVIFMSGYILEVDSLRRVERNDNTIVANLLRAVSETDAESGDEIVLLGLNWVYERKINPRITSQIRLDWGIEGHYSVLYGCTDVPHIIPVMGRDAAGLPDKYMFGLDGELNVRRLVWDDGVLRFMDTGELFIVVSTENG